MKVGARGPFGDPSLQLSASTEERFTPQPHWGCDDALVSATDGAIRRLDDALDRGDALTAWMAARELPKGRLGLDHSLALVAIVSDGDPDIADRASARWLGRVANELPGVDVLELGDVLAELPDMMAVTQLGGLCERYGWPRALSTLDHLLPGR